ncbi:hypothetical protein AA12717_1692 [Gluconacetobacter sacchari DSM 12717]|nr:hypothetical protein [Gluconacetobacter sacchari]GBQ24106.1 hypothetical protein AA12717_1692 [Gluconacetobacter sacchari DSM 12717]
MKDTHMTAHHPFRIGNPPIDHLFDTNLVLCGVLQPTLRRIVTDPAPTLLDARLEGAIVVLGLLTRALDRVVADMNRAPVMEEADHD